MVGNFHNHKIYGTIESKVPSQLWFRSTLNELQLLRLLSIYILVKKGLISIFNINASKILYHLMILLNPFCFCET